MWVRRVINRKHVYVVQSSKTAPKDIMFASSNRKTAEEIAAYILEAHPDYTTDIHVVPLVDLFRREA